MCTQTSKIIIKYKPTNAKQKKSHSEEAQENNNIISETFCNAHKTKKKDELTLYGTCNRAYGCVYVSDSKFFPLASQNIFLCFVVFGPAILFMMSMLLLRYSLLDFLTCNWNIWLHTHRAIKVIKLHITNICVFKIDIIVFVRRFCFVFNSCLFLFDCRCREASIRI